MKIIRISDELYDKLKKCIVDPFDDTPESVVERLIEIVDKSKNRCSSWDAAEDTAQQVKSQDGPITPSKSRNVQSGHQVKSQDEPATPSKSRNVRASRHGSGHDQMLL